MSSRSSVIAGFWVAFCCLAGCTRSDVPTADVVHRAIDAYLAERGDLCVGKTVWPIDVTQHEIDSGARNALQMPVLEKLGLVTSSVAEVDVDEGDVSHRLKVRRYAMTDAGRKYYLARGHGTPGHEAAHDLCAAHLSLDRVVDWNLRQSPDGSPPQAVVNYTYRVQAAPWTSDADLQRVFPAVAGVVRGAGKAQLQETLSLTEAGWVAIDLQGS